MHILYFSFVGTKVYLLSTHAASGAVLGSGEANGPELDLVPETSVCGRQGGGGWPSNCAAGCDALNQDVPTMPCGRQEPALPLPGNDRGLPRQGLVSGVLGRMRKERGEEERVWGRRTRDLLETRWVGKVREVDFGETVQGSRWPLPTMEIFLKRRGRT